MIVEERAGLSALGFLKKKKKKPAPEPDAAAALGPSLTAKLNPDGTPAGSGGGSGNQWIMPVAVIGGALIVVGVAGYFILKK